MSSNSIRDDQVVVIHYRLTCEGKEEDSTIGDEPVAYLHGHSNIPPGLEQALAGRSVGDKFEVKLSPAEGFGEPQPEGVIQIPRSELPADAELQIGMELGIEDEDGNVMAAHLTEIGDAAITVDLNHPLAGKELEYSVEVLEVRAATEEELAHGHPHGEGGVEH